MVLFKSCLETVEINHNLATVPTHSATTVFCGVFAKYAGVLKRGLFYMGASLGIVAKLWDYSKHYLKKCSFLGNTI